MKRILSPNSITEIRRSSGVQRASATFQLDKYATNNKAARPLFVLIGYHFLPDSAIGIHTAALPLRGDD